MEALAEALKGQERVRGEVPRGHLTVGLLVASRRTLALEAANQQVHTGAPVFADPRRTAARAGRQLAALTCRWTEKRKWRGMRIHIFRHAGIPSGTSLQLFYTWHLHKCNTSYRLINAPYKEGESLKNKLKTLFTKCVRGNQEHWLLFDSACSFSLSFLCVTPSMTPSAPSGNKAAVCAELHSAERHDG